MNHYRAFLAIFLLLSVTIFSQNIEESTDFEVSQDGSVIKLTSGDNVLFTRKFIAPQFEVIDLDRDGNPELYIKDTDSTSENTTTYTLYIYSALDSVKLIDSINSGIEEPYFVYSEEIEKLVIITGNSKFSKYISNENGFLPINVWQYDGDELFAVNQEVYELFLKEADEIVELLEDYYTTNEKNCNSSKEMIAAIASAYANYFNADEQSLAQKFLKKYYFCDDMEKFKQQLDTLLLED